ncbi:hypothetical protein BY996DRAFT_8393932 [Phakopsora pachyrhizi]|nr:hypothetical protein BY996DRAFT_8393932 [Phakopsora pachyrhizi]
MPFVSSSNSCNVQKVGDLKTGLSRASVGFLGYIKYELHAESLLKNSLHSRSEVSVADAKLGFCIAALTYDHKTGVWAASTLVFIDESSSEALTEHLGLQVGMREAEYEAWEAISSLYYSSYSSFAPSYDFTSTIQTAGQACLKYLSRRRLDDWCKRDGIYDLIDDSDNILILPKNNQGEKKDNELMEAEVRTRSKAFKDNTEKTHKSNYHLDPSSIQSPDLTSHTLRSPISSSSNNNHQSNLFSLTSQSNLKAPDHTNNTSNPKKHSSSPSLLRDGSNRKGGDHDQDQVDQIKFKSEEAWYKKFGAEIDDIEGIKAFRDIFQTKLKQSPLSPSDTLNRPATNQKLTSNYNNAHQTMHLSTSKNLTTSNQALNSCDLMELTRIKIELQEIKDQ